MCECLKNNEIGQSAAKPRIGESSTTIERIDQKMIEEASRVAERRNGEHYQSEDIV
jgi:hypothetical protein